MDLLFSRKVQMILKNRLAKKCRLKRVILNGIATIIKMAAVTVIFCVKTLKDRTVPFLLRHMLEITPLLHVSLVCGIIIFLR